MPISLLRKLPDNAKKIYESTYKSAKSKGLSSESAAKIAMSAVKKGYKKVNGRYVSKKSKARMTVVKTGWFSRDYFFKIDITNTMWDSDDQRVSELLLKKLADSARISPYGDVDHENYCKEFDMMDERAKINADTGTQGLYKLHNYSFNDGKLEATVSLNKDHKLYDKYLKLHKSGKFLYASAEFQNPIVEQGVIMDADNLFWTMTDNPANKTLAPMRALV